MRRPARNGLASQQEGCRQIGDGTQTLKAWVFSLKPFLKLSSPLQGRGHVLFRLNSRVSSYRLWLLLPAHLSSTPRAEASVNPSLATSAPETAAEVLAAGAPLYPPPRPAPLSALTRRGAFRLPRMLCSPLRCVILVVTRKLVLVLRESAQVFPPLDSPSRPPQGQRPPPGSLGAWARRCRLDRPGPSRAALVSRAWPCSWMSEPHTGNGQGGDRSST